MRGAERGKIAFVLFSFQFNSLYLPCAAACLMEASSFAYTSLASSSS